MNASVWLVRSDTVEIASSYHHIPGVILYATEKPASAQYIVFLINGTTRLVAVYKRVAAIRLMKIDQFVKNK